MRDDSQSKLPAFKRLSSRLFYRTMNFLTDFRLLDRTVVDAVNGESGNDLFLRGHLQWVGFEQVAIPYVPRDRFSGSSQIRWGD